MTTIKCFQIYSVLILLLPAVWGAPSTSVWSDETRSDQTENADATSGTYRWNAAQFGVAADENADATVALQAVLDKANRAGGGIVELPSGRYRINGNLSIPAGVTLQGTYRVPPTVNRKDQRVNGTVLLAYAGKGQPDGKPFITLAGDDAVLAGIVVIYPESDQKTVPPIPYPPCVASYETRNVGVLNCCLLNPYEGIRMIRADRHLLRDITGYPVWRGLFVDQCYDIGRVENFHFWPFGLVYKPKDPYCEWINKNGIAFEFARTDWEYVYNTFCFGYGVGYRFSAYEHGAANGNFLGLGADSCRRAVLVEQSQKPGLLITNGEFVGRWTSDDSVCLEIKEGNEGKVSLNNCSFWGPVETCVLAASSSGQFTANACHFVNWDNAGTGAPAIRVAAGKAIVSNSTFEESGVHVEVAPEAKSAIITGNQAQGGLVVAGKQLPQTVLSANEPTPLDQLTEEQKLKYRVDVGSESDSGFLRNWYGREKSVDSAGKTITSRWTKSVSTVLLPVVPGKSYRLSVKLLANPFKTASPDSAGLWVDGRQAATFSQSEPTEASAALARPLPTNEKELSVEIPAQKVKTPLITLEIRTPGWVPAEKSPKSNDTRKLGVYVQEIEMEAK